MKRINPIIKYFLLFSFLTANFITAQEKVDFNLLNENSKLPLRADWKYSFSDSIFSEVKNSASDWKEIQSTVFENENIFAGQKKVWLYKEFLIDSAYFNKSIGFDVFFLGDIKVYLNDKLIFTGGFGDGNPVLPVKENLDSDSVQILKVELNAENSESFISKGMIFGFEISLVKYDEFLQSRISGLSALSTRKNIFVVITLVLAVFHLSLYIFNKRKINNLFYVLFFFFLRVLFSRELCFILQRQRGTSAFLYSRI